MSILSLSFALTPTLCAAVAAALFAVPCRGQAPMWDAAASYSSTQSPSGAWSYGWALNRGAPLNPFNSTGVVYCGGLTGWSNQFPQFPAVAKNESGATICCSSVRVPNGVIVMHPGQAGENAVLRWTAPADGYYSVEVAFSGLDFQFPTNSDVAVLHNLVPVYAAELNGFTGPSSCSGSSLTAARSYSGTIQCNVGDTIDCNVGFGLGQRYNGDSTGVGCHITQVTMAELVGQSCSAVQFGYSNLPFQGQNVSLGVSFAATNAVGFVALGVGGPVPTPVLGCTVYPSLPLLDVFAITTNGLGQWGGPLAIPSGVIWNGWQFTAQALVVNPTRPQGIEMSNGILFTL